MGPCPASGREPSACVTRAVLGAGTPGSWGGGLGGVRQQGPGQPWPDLAASSPQSQYSLTRAQQSYKSLVQIHEKNGEAGASTLEAPGASSQPDGKGPCEAFPAMDVAPALVFCPTDPLRKASLVGSWRDVVLPLLRPPYESCPDTLPPLRHTLGSPIPCRQLLHFRTLAHPLVRSCVSGAGSVLGSWDREARRQPPPHCV